MYEEICFRGAGLMFPFYLGLYRGLERFSLHHNFIRMRGISSGAVVAASLMCNIPCLHLLLWFEILIKRWAEHRRFTSFQTLFWNLHLRWYFIGKFFLHFVPDDVARSCSNRLSIVAFSVTECKVIENNQWRNTKHLVEWIWAAMALPFTSPPRWVDGKLLMDAYHLDLIWPFNRSIQERNFHPHCIHTSPIETHHRILLRPPTGTFCLSEALILYRRTPSQSMYLFYRMGLQVVLRNWLHLL